MIADPPAVEGAVHASATLVEPEAVAVSPVGAPSTPTGVTDTGDDAVPAPETVTARSLTEYAVPFVRPVMVTGDVESVGDTAVQVEPPSIEYS